MERQTQGSIFPVCKSGSLQSRGEEPEVLGAGVLCGGSLQAALGVEGRGVRSSWEGCGHKGREIEEHTSLSLYVLLPNHLPSDSKGRGMEEAQGQE